MTHGFSPSAPNNPLRCDGYRSALQRSSQRTAFAIAAQCVFSASVTA